MTFFTILGMIALGALKLALFFVIICVGIAILALIATYVVAPIIDHTPDRIKAAFSLFWKALVIVFIVLFFGFMLYQIGVGE